MQIKPEQYKDMTEREITDALNEANSSSGFAVGLTTPGFEANQLEEDLEKQYAAEAHKRWAEQEQTKALKNTIQGWIDFAEDQIDLSAPDTQFQAVMTTKEICVLKRVLRLLENTNG